jgi:excisionase family DNA binding protein
MPARSIADVQGKNIEPNTKGGMLMHESTTSNADNGTKGPVLLTIDEARGVLRISRWSLYKLINARQLKTIKIGQRRLVPADDLRALLDTLRDEGADSGW